MSRYPTTLTGVSERHDPAIRRMHLDGAYEVWPDGRTERAERWEMICPQCGDDGRSFETQRRELQRLRGPFPTQDVAIRAAQEHVRQQDAAADQP